MSDPNMIDAEIVSEEKIPEKPREQRSATIGQAATSTATTVADALEKIGADEAATKVRVGIAMGQAAGETIEAVKPAIQSLADFGRKLADSGIVKMGKRENSLAKTRRRK